MRTQSGRGGARVAAVCIGLALTGALPVAVRADATAPQTASAELRGLERLRRSALLELYALERDLLSARATAGVLAAKRAHLAREQAASKRRLAVAAQAAAVSTERLGELLRRLYERPDLDPLQVLAESSSLEEALTQLENLERAAAENRRLLERARATQARLHRLTARLAARGAELARLAGAAAATARELEARTAERAAYVGELERRRAATARQIAVVEAAAKAEPPRPAAPAAPAPPAAPEPEVARDGRARLEVSAVGYSLPGRTATGLPVGYGVVAVDPAVIPLGTRMHVPGYGSAVAADVGSAIRGATIDLWFPTVAEARAWGRRTVVITLG